MSNNTRVDVVERCWYIDSDYMLYLDMSYPGLGTLYPTHCAGRVVGPVEYAAKLTLRGLDDPTLLDVLHIPCEEVTSGEVKPFCCVVQRSLGVCASYANVEVPLSYRPNPPCRWMTSVCLPLVRPPLVRPEHVAGRELDRKFDFVFPAIIPRHDVIYYFCRSVR